MNSTLELLANRHSVRAFSDQPITPEERQAILQATYRAPTAGNQMLYAIIEVDDPAVKQRLVETCDHQPFIAKAPLVLVFLADYQRWFDAFVHGGVRERCAALGQEFRMPGPGDLFLASCDALIAAQTAVIAAESLGIGSCYIGDILENYEIHREMFNLPRYTFPVTMVCFGHPAPLTNQRRVPRFPEEFILHRNTYRRFGPEEQEAMFQPLMAARPSGHSFPKGVENIAQSLFFRKYVDPFSYEMTRSVEAMLKNWTPEED